MIFIFNLIISLMLFGQSKATELEPFKGQWDGACDVVNTTPGSKLQKLGMKLTVSEIDEDNYNWIIQYEGEPARNYQMIRRKEDPKRWVLDEKNGILIERYVDPERATINEHYSINGRFFTGQTKVVGDTLNLNFHSFWISGATKTVLTGSTIEVSSHHMSNRQLCELKRLP